MQVVHLLCNTKQINLEATFEQFLLLIFECLAHHVHSKNMQRHASANTKVISEFAAMGDEHENELFQEICTV